MLSPNTVRLTGRAGVPVRSRFRTARSAASTGTGDGACWADGVTGVLPVGEEFGRPE
jgi:hypothetical protein